MLGINATSHISKTQKLANQSLNAYLANSSIDAAEP